MTDLPNIEPLARETSRGDKASEERLFAMLYKFVTASLRKHWRSSFAEDELNDILMETLEKLLSTFRNPEKTERVIEQGRLFGFVHVVAEHTALDHNRKRSRQEKVFLSYDNAPDDAAASEHWESRLKPANPAADISDVILGGMETARILSGLDEKYRTVIQQRMSGLEYDEIAENNNISLANARQIHRRGISMLREQLISKHRSVLGELSVSQNATLKRLYLKDEATDHGIPCPEEEALEAFYAALMNKGIFLAIITIGFLV